MRRCKIFFLVFCLILTSAGSSSVLLADADPMDEVIFFGDSTTAHLSLRGGIPSSRVWSGAGSTVLFETVNHTKCVHLSAEGRDLTLRDAVALKKPKILVITIGVSGGAGQMPEDAFLEIYQTLLRSVREASPETKILVQSILPLADGSVKYYKRLTKEAVLEANGWIASLCAEMQIPYVNTHDRLLDSETGYLKKEYQNDEYMHLTTCAYQVVLDSVREAVRAHFSGL